MSQSNSNSTHDDLIATGVIIRDQPIHKDGKHYTGDRPHLSTPIATGIIVNDGVPNADEVTVINTGVIVHDSVPEGELECSEEAILQTGIIIHESTPNHETEITVINTGIIIRDRVPNHRKGYEAKEG